MSSKTLIKGGKVVTASQSFTADVLIQDGKIKTISADIETPDFETSVIDAKGLYLLPGGIDPHVHMELPVGNNSRSSDDFFTGSRAAIAGGTTTIIDFVTPERGQSLFDATIKRKSEAEKSVCDYALHVSVTRWNDDTPKQLRVCRVHEGITSIKLYMAYKKNIGLEDEEILKVMDCAAQSDSLITMHCEHDETINYLREKFISQGKIEPRYHPLSRPPEVEAEAVKRAILMAKVTGCKLYIVHVSTREAVEEIKKAQSEGQPIFGETCPHYLLLDHREYNLPGFAGASYMMSPPLRPHTHQTSLWRALKQEVLQTLATDHCPFLLKDRNKRGNTDFSKIPNGVAGVEHRMMLLFTFGVLKKRISLEEFVKVTSEQPARIFGLFPQKGIIAEGSDADILIWDPSAKTVISSSSQLQNCDTTIYEGMAIQGKPAIVMLRGEIAYKNGEVVLPRGSGKYLSRL